MFRQTNGHRAQRARRSGIYLAASDAVLVLLLLLITTGCGEPPAPARLELAQSDADTTRRARSSSRPADPKSSKRDSVSAADAKSTSPRPEEPTTPAKSEPQQRPSQTPAEPPAVTTPPITERPATEVPDKPTSSVPPPSDPVPPISSIPKEPVDRPIASVEASLPLDVLNNVQLTWSTELGDGGGTIPRLPRQDNPELVAPITHVTGVYLPAESEELILLGEAVEGFPPLDPEQLFDAFATIYGSVQLGQPPSVSIDPTPQQLVRGLKARDLMDVVFFGQTQNTAVGHAIFEADRLLKCLSFGKDSVTNAPMAKPFDGFQNELELIAAAVRLRPSADRQKAWHRFWIEPRKSHVKRSEDGRTWFSDTTLAVNTQYMKVGRQGKLVPAGKKADPAAEAFCKQMTKNFRTCGLKYPTFQETETYATLTAIAEAIRKHKESDELTRRISERLSYLLGDHEVRPFATSLKTPALVADIRIPFPRGEITLQLTGGVKLASPKNGISVTPSLEAKTVGAAVDRAKGTKPKQRSWAIQTGNRRFHAVSARPRRNLTLWQTDLKSGRLALTREYSEHSKAGEFGDGWNLRRPRLRLSLETSEFENGRAAPSAVTLKDENGAQITLPNFGTMQMPGQPATKGYWSDNSRVKAYFFTNQIFVVQGDIEFISRNGGPPVPTLGRNDRILVFQPTGTSTAFKPGTVYKLNKIQTTQGTTNYKYDGDKLTEIRNSRGDSIRFTHDANGRIASAQTNDNQRRTYVRDGGHLRQVLDTRGNGITYDHGVFDGKLGGMQANLRTRIDPTTIAQFAIKSSHSESRAAALDAPTATPRQFTHLNVELDRKGNSNIVSIDGKVNDALQKDLQALSDRQRALKQSGSSGQLAQTPEAKSVRERLSALRPDREIIVTGDGTARDRLSSLLTESLSDYRVLSAEDPALAVKNRSELRQGARLAELHLVGLDQNIAKQLQETARPKESSNVVLIAGQKTAELIESITALAPRLQGKQVVIITFELSGGAASPKLSGLKNTILDKYHASCVAGYDGAIPQELAPKIIRRWIEELNNRADTEPQTLDAIRRKIQREFQEEFRNDKKLPAPLLDDLKKAMESSYERIGTIPAQQRTVVAGFIDRNSCRCGFDITSEMQHL